MQFSLIKLASKYSHSSALLILFNIIYYLILFNYLILSFCPVFVSSVKLACAPEIVCIVTVLLYSVFFVIIISYRAHLL